MECVIGVSFMLDWMRATTAGRTLADLYTEVGSLEVA